MYARLAYRGTYDVNFYYDPETFDAIHITLGKIRDILHDAGAERILKELQ